MSKPPEHREFKAHCHFASKADNTQSVKFIPPEAPPPGRSLLPSGGGWGWRATCAAAAVAIAILHAGYVSTDMTAGQGNVDPDETARMLIQRIDVLTLETSGTFWHANGQVLPW